MKVLAAAQFTAMALVALASMVVHASPIPKPNVAHHAKDSYVQTSEGTSAVVTKRNDVVLTGVSSQDYITSHNQPYVESSSVPDLLLR